MSDDKNSQLRAVGRENPEPEEGQNPWPYAVWLFFGVMIGWGVTYMWFQVGNGRLAGGDHRTLTEPNSVVENKIDGSTVFKNICMACHQSTGLGIAGAFPPLVGSEWLLNDSSIPARIVLHGLQGPMIVKGQAYNNVMPPFGAALNDGEIAAVVTWVRTQWGNSAPAISEKEVAALRAKDKGKNDSWKPEELRP